MDEPERQQRDAEAELDLLGAERQAAQDRFVAR
jgi:hypothetical protein